MTYHWDTDPSDILVDIDLSQLEALRAAMDNITNTPPTKLPDILRYLHDRHTTSDDGFFTKYSKYIAMAIIIIAVATAGAVVIVYCRACGPTCAPRTTKPTTTKDDSTLDPDAMELILHPTAPPRRFLLEPCRE
jgi:hypothetical protein